MNDLRQPLVGSPHGDESSRSRQDTEFKGSNQTMLTVDPGKKISQAASGGLNRREERELTSFGNPVLDIEKMNRRSRQQVAKTNEFSRSRGADISEDMQFVDSSLNKENNIGVHKSAYHGSDHDMSFDNGLSSKAPYTLSEAKIQGVNSTNSQWSDRFFALYMTLIAFVLFTASFTCIGILSAPMITDQDEIDRLDHLQEESSPSSLLQITYLPFYSSAAIFTVLNFVVYGILVLVRNCVRYARFGVTSSSDYYTPEETLKVSGLLLSLFGGELLFSGLISFFYIQQQSFYQGMMQSVNTSLLLIVALFLLMAAYFGFGVHVQLQQTIGSFIIIVGYLCMYIALSGAMAPTDEHEGELSHNTESQAIKTLGMNSIAALCFSGVFIILKVNHQRSEIKWHSGIFMISFIAFLTSAIILVALQCLTLLTDSDFMHEEVAHEPGHDWSAKKQLMQLSLASATFSLGLLFLGFVLERRSTTRCFALFSLIPLSQLGFEYFVLGEDWLTKAEFVCMLTITVGALLITTFISKPDAVYYQKETARRPQNQSQVSIVFSDVDRQRSRVQDRQANAVIRFPANLDNNSAFE